MPLVIKPAAIPVRAGTVDALVELVDVPATVESLTGLVPEHTHFGRSLIPLMTGQVDDHRDAVFCEGGRLAGEEHAMEMESTSVGDAAENSRYWPRLRLQRGAGPEHTRQ